MIKNNSDYHNYVIDSFHNSNNNKSVMNIYVSFIFNILQLYDYVNNP